MQAAESLKFATLRNGRKMPRVGLGTWQLSKPEAYEATLSALKAGYRHIDTAAIYHNERSIGKAIKDSGIPREEIWLTSKLSPYDQGFDAALSAFSKSIEKLNTTYLDLYLIHWPGKNGEKVKSSANQTARIESWKALNKLYAEGKCRAIGVSNFLERHLKELRAQPGEMPHVNQCECHPYLPRTQLFEFCKSLGIFFQAYSSLGVGSQDLLKEPVVISIAQKRSKTPAQVLLRWAVQQGIGILPRSKQASRIQENFDIFDFELAPEELKSLTALGKNKHFCWDPEDVR